MGTRGEVIFKKSDVLKGQYNQYDSYFEGLGQDIINAINSIPKEERIKVLNETFDRIIMVKEDDKPTQEIIDYCVNDNLVDLAVSSRSYDDMYCLFRKAQGRLDYYINGGKYMLDGGDFYKDTVFCEYAYTINLDNNTLEMNGTKLGKLNDLNYDIILKKVKKAEDDEDICLF
jgi:hypothetical protein